MSTVFFNSVKHRIVASPKDKEMYCIYFDLQNLIGKSWNFNHQKTTNRSHNWQHYITQDCKYWTQMIYTALPGQPGQHRQRNLQRERGPTYWPPHSSAQCWHQWSSQQRPRGTCRWQRVPQSWWGHLACATRCCSHLERCVCRLGWRCACAGGDRWCEYN